jgi:hypothetical protein
MRGLNVDNRSSVSAFGGSGFLPIVVNSVGAIQSQHAKKSDPLTEKGELPISGHRGTRKTKRRRRLKDKVGKAQARAKAYKNRPKHTLTLTNHWGSPGALFSFLPSPESLHLQYLNMSGASSFPGAHHFVASNSMFNTANTVSRMVIM